jgi:hypothetical protein
MVDRRVEVVGRLKLLEESAAPLISFLQNPALVQELRSDKQYNLQMLRDKYQVSRSKLFNALRFLVSVQWKKFSTSFLSLFVFLFPCLDLFSFYVPGFR